MSPKFFSIYVDELITITESLDPGLRLNDENKIEIIVYADDILLLSTSKYGLKTQLEAIEEYGNKYEIKFNPDKTSFMIFNQAKTRSCQEKRADTWQADVMLNGIAINQVKSMKYLGVHISDDDKNKVQIDNRKKSAITALARLNKLGFTT
ncbi:RNA-directed DNA polymerase from mobile element jockey-like [Brachionus plicatilis]|uniref:RNA-directed DNA polymerase from mobile element jockey-like n=1 Tax=Brachionus plicatilis TaxID=10195 RepID=A0A3M7P5P6_BRAPC|nr:RNA-directed DNA polymerase from mobile element jockey-like [Brachionus plicatilis]